MLDGQRSEGRPNPAGPRRPFDVEVLTRTSSTPPPPDLVIMVAESVAERTAAADLRRQVFVAEQGLFADDRDWHDDDPRTVTLVATTADRQVLGTVRIAPALTGRDLGWWTGSRLAVRADARGHRLGVGSALVRAACAHAENLGALRFDASVQVQNARLFDRLGWRRVGDPPRPEQAGSEPATGRASSADEPLRIHGVEHVGFTWPLHRIQRLADRTKAPLADLLAGLAGDHRFGLGGAGFRGDDGAPVPGSDLIAATDAILPSMVERDPDWAGWCAVLVNVNDLAAMGAEPVALLDAVAGRDRSFVTRVLGGLRRAASAWQVPVIGGHTQLGVPASLSVTALGRSDRPVAASGARAGQQVRLTADLEGGWRPGYRGLQWDSTSTRRSSDLVGLQSFVARSRPAAAKDVSMAGLAGTAGMLAEAGGCGAVLDVADIPTPAEAGTADWLTCFPGFAMITTDRRGAPPADPGPATTAVCGELVAEPGVALRWPDGRTTKVISDGVTGIAS